MSGSSTAYHQASSMEGDYHNPYDHHQRFAGLEALAASAAAASATSNNTSEADGGNVYEAPSCLVRNPSGSLFIPSAGDPLGGQTTLDSRLRYDAYSPHRQMTLQSSNHHPHQINNLATGNGPPGLRDQNSRLNSGTPPCRSPTNNDSFKLDRGTLSAFSNAPGTLSTRLGNGNTTLLASGGGNSNQAPPGAGAAAVLHRRSSPNSSSAYSQSQWRVQKDNMSGVGRCSWKFVAIFFMLLSVILVSALIYTTASNFINDYDNVNACAVVETSSGDTANSRLSDSSSANSISRFDTKNSLRAQSANVNPFLGGGSNLPRLALPPDGSTFAHLTIGEPQAETVRPYSFWNFQFQQKRPSYVRMEFEVVRGSSLGFYARKNAIPTMTLNDVKDVITGFKDNSLHRQTRSIPSVSKNTSYYLESGHWFISIYNDDGESKPVRFVATVSEDMTRNCPRGCSGRGDCVLGRCQCRTGFDGPDCGQSMCPVLCSGNGDYDEGRCRCFPGWKGSECQLTHNQCEVADCNGRGKCLGGKCRCAQGFTGDNCEKADCADPTCGGHGFCVDGSCVCRQGWTGPDCSQTDHEARQCLPDCSGHGEFDLETQQCRCRGQWTGKDCSKERCNLDCGPHGECESGQCVCQPGWTGDMCSTRECDPRCHLHGQCSNGTCLCTNGYNGKHCTLEGCPSNCNDKGHCDMDIESGEWQCQCQDGWFGKGCDIYLEQDCSDRKDNDGDGLIDCEDPECCENPVCQKSQLCHTVSSPLDILLRKQSPSMTASFFERMKFIIEDKGLQSYVEKAGFNESRAAVVRGQVVTKEGMGLIGVRVSTNIPNEGFTMTREDGWFDLMVSGGGPVMLQFGRVPYASLRLNVFVPWNEVVVLDPVKLSKRIQGSGAVVVPDLLADRKPCPQHDSAKMRPLVFATWKHGFQGQSPDGGSILVESQALQESLDIGNGMHLVHHSARTKGYLSVLQLQLTPSRSADVPDTLVRVHLKITIEGVVHQHVFEADPDIRYTYAWDRLNQYRQRVYGVTTATVKVGYQYEDCDTVWNVQTTQLAGHDMTETDVNGWNLDVTHKYNHHAGILQKGDGNTVYLKYKPQVVTTVIGNGEQRSVDCTSNTCVNGEASKQKVLAPKALAAGPDGAVYLADYNLIRKVNSDSTVSTVLKLNSSRVGNYRFHLAHSTMIHDFEHRQTVYVSQPEMFQVIRIKDVLDRRDSRVLSDSEVERNWESFIGNGERCLPGDSDKCGDGGHARDARLAYPKGIAVAADGKVFIADGTNIRQVDEHGTISTLIGHQHHRSSNWRPMPCNNEGGGSSMSVDQVQLNWPTELAVSPLDGSLHIVDDNVVLKVGNDGLVRVVAGRPLHCPPPPKGGGQGQSEGEPMWATSTSLASPQSIAFAPNGDLYVAESDSQRINRVRKVLTDGRIVPLAGRDSNCNCLDASCQCFERDTYLATNTLFSAISSITVSPDSTLYVADQGNARVRSVGSSLSASGGGDREAEATGVFEVPDPEANQAYVFNKYGQHMLTRDIMTGSTLYTMAYTKTTSNGKLRSVTDSYGRKVSVMRDYRGNANAIQDSAGRKFELNINPDGHLRSFKAPDGYMVNFNYDRGTGLIESKVDSANLGYVYRYNKFGRLVGAVYPTGEKVDLQFNLTSSDGARIQVTRNGRPYRSVTVRDNQVSQQDDAANTAAAAVRGKRAAVITVGKDKTLKRTNSAGQILELSRLSHPVIAATSDPVLADSFPITNGQRLKFGSALVQEAAWHYSVTTNSQSHRSTSDMMNVKKTLKSNGENLLSVFYDKLQKRELLLAEANGVDRTQKQELLEVRYDSSLRPISWQPKAGGFEDMKQSYDRFGNLEKWTWGPETRSFDYDSAGRLIAVTSGIGANSTVVKYSYQGSSSQPAAVITSSGAIYKLNQIQRNGDKSAAGSPGGELRNVVTPRGHIHSFRVKPAAGMVRFQYQAPWNTGMPYQLHYDASGKILAVIMPSRDGERVTYGYNDAGQLRKVVAGFTEVELGYDASTGLLESANVRSDHRFNMRTRFKYHTGLLKEQKTVFMGSSSPDFSIAVFRYQYDGNGRPSLTVGSIGGQNEKTFTEMTSYHSVTGQVENISGLSVSHPSFNKTVLQDDKIGYYKSIEVNGNGRVHEVVYGLNRREVFGVKVAYDPQGRVVNKLVRNHESGSREVNLGYTRDGQLRRVWGPDNYEYEHDENGNVVARTTEGLRTTYSYDQGDRVTSVRQSDGTQSAVTYDTVTGCLDEIGDGRTTRRFWHNSAGQTVQSVTFTPALQMRTTFHYDHLGRLAAWTGHSRSLGDSSSTSGKAFGDKVVTQLFYTDVRNPFRVTAVHNPRIGLTQRLRYDPSGHLVAIESKEQRMLVATDVDGSPVLVYRPDGSVIKEVSYSPFGRVVRDTNPNMKLPVGFRGGVVVANNPSSLLFMTEERKFYDADLGQWFCPGWREALTQPMTSPFDIFHYRYKNNNPADVSTVVRNVQSRSSMESWSKLFGFNLDDIFTSVPSTFTASSTGSAQLVPEHKVDLRTMLPDLSMVSGLEAVVDSAKAGLGQMSFVTRDRHQSDFITLNGRFASAPSALGNGFLLSVVRRPDGSPDTTSGLASPPVAVANAIKNVPGSVLQNVLESLVNGSQAMPELWHFEGKRSFYYFAKVSSDMSNQVSIDEESVRRLSGAYAVSINDLDSGGKDLKISNSQLELHVIYSSISGSGQSTVTRFRDKVMQSAASRSKQAAWRHEKALVKNGFTGYGDWTRSQRSELKSRGQVGGYDALQLQPVGRFPQLVRDQSNFGFVSELQQQRRRKNRHERKSRKNSRE